MYKMNSSKKLTKIQQQALEIQKLKAQVKDLITSKKAYLNHSTHSALHKQLEKKTTINKLNTFKEIVESHTPLANTIKKVKQEKVMIVEEKKKFRNILKENKKNISFYVSFYVPLTSDYKGNDVVHFNGKEYKGFSRKNGNSGSYFLEKHLTLNTDYLLKQLNKYRTVLDTDINEYMKLKTLLQQFIGYDDFNGKLCNVCKVTSGFIICFI